MAHIYSNDEPIDLNIPSIKYIRRNQFLSIRAADVIVDRCETLIAHGYDFNRQININLEQACVENPHKFISQFTNKMKKWHQDQNISFCYLWVLERDMNVGLHVHILIHTAIQSYHMLDIAMSDWLPFDRDDKDSKKHTIFHTGHVDDVWEVIGYRIKGLNKRFEHTLIKKRWSRSQGYIEGQRWGMTRGQYS